jgi:phosphatidyl-myo-inositol dimannoside synthase
MKILLTARGAGAAGGSGRNVGNMMRALSLAGHQVSFVSADNTFFRTMVALRRAAKGVDIVQAIDINPVGVAAYISTRLTRTKLVIVCQAAYAVAPLHSKKWASVARFVYRHADGVIAGSSFVAEEIQKEVTGLKVAIIDPGINMAQFSDVDDERALTEPLIIGVGSIKARKGYDVAVRAVAIIAKHIPNVHYVIIGSQNHEPRYVESLKILTRELGIERNIEFRTNVSDAELKMLYGQAALFMLPSVNFGFHFEGFGMVFLEAAAYGIPSIGTEGNGIAGAVENCKTGFLVPQRDPEATAAAAEKILTDPALAHRMRVRAKAFAQEHDLQHIAGLYEQFYNEMHSL